MYIVSCYLAYIAISIRVTVWIAETLHRKPATRRWLTESARGD